MVGIYCHRNLGENSEHMRGYGEGEGGGWEGSYILFRYIYARTGDSRGVWKNRDRGRLTPRQNVIGKS